MWLQKLIDAVNTIHDNLLSLAILGAGVALTIKGQSGVGSNLITLGAAVFQRTAGTTATSSSTATSDGATASESKSTETK